MQAEVIPAGARPQPDLLGVYRAPFLIEKLLLQKTVATEQEGEALFREVTRYLWLVESDRSREWTMFSLRVDQAWHQFVLFTTEYAEFCQRFFGRFLHHVPSSSAVASARPVATWDDFVAAYRALYGEPPPEVWKDETSVCGARRVIRDREVEVRLQGSKAELVGRPLERGDESAGDAGDDGEALVRVDARGEAALRFIARRGIFYVRELPGIDLDDRIAVCHALVASGTLRVAP